MNTPLERRVPHADGHASRPWASWARRSLPLCMPPADADAVVHYSNMATPVPLAA